VPALRDAGEPLQSRAVARERLDRVEARLAEDGVSSDIRS
jgi:hypothetical protein